MHTDLFVSSIVASQTRYPRYCSQVTGSGGAASFCYTDERLKPVKATCAHHRAPFHCTHQCNIAMPPSCASGEVADICPKFVSKPLHEINTHCTHSLLCGVVGRAVFMHMDTETPILQACYQEHSLYLEWRMEEACDSPPLLWGVPALVPRKAFYHSEIPWVRQAKAKEGKTFIWHSG